MNKPTPETDENRRQVEISTGYSSLCDYNFARKLERERDEARDERDSARDSYQIVKDSLHDHSTRLETLIAACDDHADGSVDATPLGKFCNEMAGLSNGVMLHEVLTLRAERDRLRESCEELSGCLKNPAIFQRYESIEALRNYYELPHVKERLSK